MTDDQLLRYSRHILLPEIGIEGQEKLLESRALVIGAGGLGSPAALYLATAGVGDITLADNDSVDLDQPAAPDSAPERQRRQPQGAFRPGDHRRATTRKSASTRSSSAAGQARGCKNW